MNAARCADAAGEHTREQPGPGADVRDPHALAHCSLLRNARAMHEDLAVVALEALLETLHVESRVEEVSVDPRSDADFLSRIRRRSRAAEQHAWH